MPHTGKGQRVSASSRGRGQEFEIEPVRRNEIVVTRINDGHDTAARCGRGDSIGPLADGPKYPQTLQDRGVTLTPTPHFEAIDQSHRAIDEARADQPVVEIVNGTADCRNREQRECDDEYGRPGDCVSKALHAVFRYRPCQICPTHREAIMSGTPGCHIGA
jgi:hypothetical protein